LPTVAVGIVIIWLNAPVEFVDVVTRNAESKMILILVILGVNPMPVTVAVEPEGPLEGDTVMVGVAFTMLNPTAAILEERIDIINTETYLFKFIPRSNSYSRYIY